MSNEYQIKSVGNQFTVIDPWGELLGNVYPTEDAAKQDIERCKKDDEMWETAKLLVDIAIKAHMERFGVDREISCYWIRSASEVSD